MLRLAHLSDPHLGPMPAVSAIQLANKRVLGYMNWHRHRKSFHSRDVADLLVQDLATQNADHIAITGDLVNISLEREFANALDWLADIGTGECVSVVPGNHDAYVRLSWDATLGLWNDYMRSCDRGAAHAGEELRFPFVRLFGDVAIIGLSTAVPTPPLFASGCLGERQLTALDATLRSLAERNCYRIVLIHHPPLPRQGSRRKGLSDTVPLTEMLTAHEVNLVLHGHAHFDMHESVTTPHGATHVFGVPSASGTHGGHRPAAQYNLYTVERTGEGWRCDVTIRGLAVDGKSFATIKEFTLPASTKC